MRKTLTILALALAASANGSEPGKLSALVPEFESALKDGVLEVWYPRCVDEEKGGFLCDFDHRWRPRGPHDKTVVFQARQTWVAAKAMLRYPADPRYERAARHGFKWLREKQWDPEHGGWYWWLDRDGKVKKENGDFKHAYGISFGIYASAAYYAARRTRRA